MSVNNNFNSSNSANFPPINFVQNLQNSASSTNKELAEEPVSLSEIQVRIAEACLPLCRFKTASRLDVKDIFTRPLLSIQIIGITAVTQSIMSINKASKNWLLVTRHQETGRAMLVTNDKKAQIPPSITWTHEDGREEELEFHHELLFIPDEHLEYFHEQLASYQQQEMNTLNKTNKSTPKKTSGSLKGQSNPQIVNANNHNLNRVNTETKKRNSFRVSIDFGPIIAKRSKNTQQTLDRIEKQIKHEILMDEILKKEITVHDQKQSELKIELLKRDLSNVLTQIKELLKSPEDVLVSKRFLDEIAVLVKNVVSQPISSQMKDLFNDLKLNILLHSKSLIESKVEAQNLIKEAKIKP